MFHASPVDVSRLLRRYSTPARAASATSRGWAPAFASRRASSFENLDGTLIFPARCYTRGLRFDVLTGLLQRLFFAVLVVHCSPERERTISSNRFPFSDPEEANCIHADARPAQANKGSFALVPLGAYDNKRPNRMWRAAVFCPLDCDNIRWPYPRIAALHFPSLARVPPSTRPTPDVLFLLARRSR